MADRAVLLDASALLALVFDEPGADAVAAALDGAAVGAVNLTEAIEVGVRAGHPADRAAAWAGDLGMPVLPFDAAAAVQAAALLAAHRRRGLSLGDCACLGTARARGLPVLTADRAWAALGGDLGVEVRPIR